MQWLDTVPTWEYNLKFDVEDIDSFGMTVSMVSHYALLQYEVSCFCDPMNDLLEAFLKLMDSKPEATDERMVQDFKVMVDHNCLDENMIWILRWKQGDFYLYLWHLNPEEAYLELNDDFYSEFEEPSETLTVENFLYLIGNLPNPARNLVYAIKGKPEQFARTFKNTLDGILKMKYDKGIEQAWGYDIDQDRYNRLLHYLQ